MGALKVIKKSIAAGWNVSAWVGTKQIKSNALLIKDLAKSAFIPCRSSRAAAQKGNFAQAMRRLGMTEADLQKRIKTSTKLFFSAAAEYPDAGLYRLYIYVDFYLSSFVCLMLTFLLSAYSFSRTF